MHSYCSCVALHNTTFRLPPDKDKNVLLCVPSQQRQVEDERHPVAVDQEQDSQESVDTGLGDDVHVQAVAEVDRVDVVAFQVRVHDGEEHLQEEVDGIEQNGQEEKPACVLAGAQWYTCGISRAALPSFSSHFGGVCVRLCESAGMVSLD